MEEAVGRIQQLEFALQQQIKNLVILQQTPLQQQATISGLTATGPSQTSQLRVDGRNIGRLETLNGEDCAALGLVD
eukprot:10641340-Karenia_brevis.AAC.1